MKLLQKILFVAMIGVFDWNVSGILPPALPPAPVVHPILDLPIGANGTPGLHLGHGGNPVQINMMVNGVNASCLHIIVPGTPAAANGIHARNFDGNIYFPRNGVQPITAEAVQYSCANVDNRENSPITEWYMKMFGVISINPVHLNVFVQAGWNNAAPPIAQPIITCGFLGDLASDLHKIGELTIPNTPQLGNVHLNAINNVVAIHAINKADVDHLIIALENPAFNASVIIGATTAVINGIHAAIIASPPGTVHENNATTYAHNIANQIGIAVSRGIQATVGVPVPAANAAAQIVVSPINDATIKMNAYAGATVADAVAINALIAPATGAIGVVGPALLSADAVLGEAIRRATAVVVAASGAVPLPHGAGRNAAIRAVNIAKDVEKAIKNVVNILRESKQKLRLLSQKMLENDKSIGTFVAEMEIFFKKNFRKIASTSVGRTLLYRILIEIRRHLAVGNNVGCLGADASAAAPAEIDARNAVRQIVMDFGKFSFSLRGKIFIENTPEHFHYVISNVTGNDIRGKYDGIVRFKDCRDVSLFHEINHWHHKLRDPNRQSNERNGVGNYILHFDGSTTNDADPPVNVPARPAVLPANSNEVGAYYYILGGVAVIRNNMLESEKKWGRNSRANYEEIRNIIGIPSPQIHGSPNAINGDDLSENLYRMCIGSPLRLGHVVNNEFYEDSCVINKVTASCALQKAHYNCINRIFGEVNFLYNEGRKGLGSAEFR